MAIATPMSDLVIEIIGKLMRDKLDCECEIIKSESEMLDPSSKWHLPPPPKKTITDWRSVHGHPLFSQV